jgi:hypothetical protein
MYKSGFNQPDLLGKQGFCKRLPRILSRRSYPLCGLLAKSEMNPFGVGISWLTQKGLPFWKIAKNGRFEKSETTSKMW